MALTIDLSQIEGDIKTAVADAQALLTFVEKIELALPVQDQQLVTKAQNVLGIIESVLTVLGV